MENEKKKMLLAAETLHQEINHKVINGSSYMDSLIEYANENNIEIESLAMIIKKSPVLKSRLKTEASNLKMLKPEAKDNESIPDEFFK